MSHLRRRRPVIPSSPSFSSSFEGADRVAIYLLNMKTFGRANGSSAISAVAYRAGERIRDERTGRVYDHSERKDVMHKEIILPGKFADDDMAWALDRANLWNSAERAETRSNARIAREYLVALPVELSPHQRMELVKGFSQGLSDRYGYAVDFAIHAPRDFPGSDPRNFHAHLLTTTRVVAIEGLGAKTTLDMSDRNRREAGLEPAINELLYVRERWSSVANEALQEAHMAARIDHRSLEIQGIDREPRPQIPRAAFEMERHGYRSLVAERLRAEYQKRIQARLDRVAEKSTSATIEPDVRGPIARPRSLEEIRQEARQNWLRMRAERSLQPEHSPDEVQSQSTRNRTHDEDLAH
jgi:ATP-dependent exoDNAse (exonuclease V) alpha subunit